MTEPEHPWPAGTAVRLARPESPRHFRAGQAGRVRSCVTREYPAVPPDERRGRPGKPARTSHLYTVDFETPVKAGDGRDLGRVPALAFAHELERERGGAA